MMFYHNTSIGYNHSYTSSSSSSSGTASPEEQSIHDLLPSADWLSMPPSSMLYGNDDIGTLNDSTLGGYPSFQSPLDYPSSQNSLSHIYWGARSLDLSMTGAPLTRQASTPSSLSSLSDGDLTAPSSTAASPLVMPTEEEYRLYELARENNNGFSQSLAATGSPAQGGQISLPATLTTGSAVAGPSTVSTLSTASAQQKKQTRSATSSKVKADEQAEKFWEAVLKRDGADVGAFWYGVTSTKIYCRPSCASRRPMRTNVVFFESLQEASEAGYRPCKRCKPEDILEPSVVRQTTSVLRAATLIEESISAHQKPPSLTQLAAAVNMSPFYFQRTFKKHYGVSPKTFGMNLAKARLGQ